MTAEPEARILQAGTAQELSAAVDSAVIAGWSPRSFRLDRMTGTWLARVVRTPMVEERLSAE